MPFGTDWEDVASRGCASEMKLANVPGGRVLQQIDRA